MSAQLTLTDAEMEALQRCVDLAGQALVGNENALSSEEIAASLSAYRKFNGHLQRASRRRPKRGPILRLHD